MVARSILIFLLLFSLFFETTIFSFPAVLILCLILYIYFPDTLSLLVIFIASLFLDMLRLSALPATFIFLLVSFASVEFLRSSLDFSDVKSTMLVVFIAVFVYARFFGYFPSVIMYGLLFILTFFVVDLVSRKYILK